jgi:hypothetical protein
MAFEAKESKTLNLSETEVRQAISAVLERLGGKSTKKNNPAQGYFETIFNKKIQGEYMNNRIQLEIKVVAQAQEQSVVSSLAYPVDPVGQKLMFGVRGKPARLVLDKFFAELATQSSQT